MPNLNTGSKKLTLTVKVILTIAVVLFFIFIEINLWSRFIADRFHNQALRYIKKIENIDSHLAVEKVLYYRRALNLLKKAQILNPGNSNYPFAYAEVIIKFNTNRDVGGLFELLEIREGEGGYWLAKTKYLQAVFLEPTNAIFHLRLGACYDSLKDPVQAEKEFQYAELLDPTNVGDRVYLTKYFLNNKKNEEARKNFIKAKKICSAIAFGANSCNEIRELLSIMDEEEPTFR